MSDDARAWLSRLGLDETDDSLAAVREALDAHGGGADAPEAVIRLLAAASPLGPSGSGGAHLALDRLRSSDKGNDLARLAGYVAEAAALGPHPAHVYAAVARWIVEPAVPVMSDEAYAGTARLAAAECRMNARREALAERLAAERRSRPLRDTSVWAALIAGTDDEESSAHERFEVVRAALSGEDVDGLIDACGSDATDQELRTCLGLLGRLLTDRDPRLGPGRHARWAATLRDRVLAAGRPFWEGDRALGAWALADRAGFCQDVLARYGRSGRIDRERWRRLIETRGLAPADVKATAAVLARVARAELEAGRPAWEALGLWAALDRRGAGRFLTRTIDPARLPEQARRAVVSALLRLGTKAAIARLRDIEAAGGDDSADALVALEILGAVAEDRVEALAGAWREARTHETLEVLHHAYLDRLPVGTPFARWLRHLGIATRERSFWVTPADGRGGLFIELDRKGRLSGMSFR